MLWLFGDTFVAKSAPRSRSDAWFLRNSIGIQSGSYDPSRATMTFQWGRQDEHPGSFFPEDGEHFFWPLAGARAEGRLILFLMDELPSPGGLGFAPQRTRVVSVPNPDDDPSQWRVEDAHLPGLPFPVALGAGVAPEGGALFALAVHEPGEHQAYLARFDLADLARGDASEPLFLYGDQFLPPTARPGLLPSSMLPADSPLDLPPVELSLVRRSETEWQIVHSVGFGATRIGLRTAGSPSGPWSAACPVFTPPEAADPGATEYSAKAHPELHGADVVATYATNAPDLARLANDMNLYYPRFVRIDFAR